ncbi:hypothetical protein BOX15_Mlig033472g1, partial [Macrostomum lignano]
NFSLLFLANSKKFHMSLLSEVERDEERRAGARGDGDVDQPANAQELAAMSKLISGSGLLDVREGELEVQQRNPNSPLHSVKAFEQLNLSPKLIRGIYQMGFMRPSRIQEKALPALVADPPINMIAQSQSGTGKTAAFLLTMLSRVDPNENYCQCLCLAPTFELAKQIGEVCKRMAAYMPEVKIGYATREEKYTRDSYSNHHILIATPGTAQDWVMRYRIINMAKLRVFVLDEADVLIDQQAFRDISVRLSRHLSPGCQILLFSATFEEPVVEFARTVVPEAATIRLKRQELTLDNLLQVFARPASIDIKYQYVTLTFGLFGLAQCMVFCQSRREAEVLQKRLQSDGHDSLVLHGQMEISDRASIIRRYRNSEVRILITTNVLARGIDIAQVNVVINWELPVMRDRSPDFETYLHRIGRAGRFGKKGIGLSFVVDDTDERNLRQIEKHFCTQIHEMNMDDPVQLNELQKKVRK